MKIPQGVKISLEGSKVTASGKLGTLAYDFSHPKVKLSLNGQELTVSAPESLAKTIESHLSNMCSGVVSGYARKLRSLYSHFPISLEVKGREILIKNFLGEKQPRHSKVVGQTKVEVKGQEITLLGPSKEEVGQTAANLKSATRIRNRDSRVFQDGFYMVSD